MRDGGQLELQYGLGISGDGSSVGRSDPLWAMMSLGCLGRIKWRQQRAGQRPKTTGERCKTKHRSATVRTDRAFKALPRGRGIQVPRTQPTLNIKRRNLQGLSTAPVLQEDKNKCSFLERAPRWQEPTVSDAADTPKGDSSQSTDRSSFKGLVEGRREGLRTDNGLKKACCKEEMDGANREV